MIIPYLGTYALRWELSAPIELNHGSHSLYPANSHLYSSSAGFRDLIEYKTRHAGHLPSAIESPKFLGSLSPCLLFLSGVRGKQPPVARLDRLLKPMRGSRGPPNSGFRFPFLANSSRGEDGILIRTKLAYILNRVPLIHLMLN